MCGIFGIYNNNEAAHLTYLGLYALQHRGQESAGIVSSNDKSLIAHVNKGYVNDVFNEEVLKKLTGNNAIGHVRYATSGKDNIKNAQPIYVKYSQGQIAVAHNGHILNANHLRTLLEERGSIFQTTSDTEVIVHLIARSQAKNLVQKINEALSQIIGAYSLLFITPENIIAVRDPYGFRPLCLGKLNDSPVFSSETSSFDLIGAKYERDILPGEIVVCSRDGMQSFMLDESKPTKKYAHCIFEHIYFARPDSIVFGKNVYSIRTKIGQVLAQESPVDADIVIPVPDSGVPASIGYSHESKIPLEFGLIRNHYVGRTFIEPKQSIRHFGVKIKLNPVKEILKGKKIIVIDDSIVRGTTSQKIIKMIRDAGAKEIHLRISSPKITHSCFYGIDTPTREELIAANNSVNEINKFIGSDSLYYLSIEGLKKSIGDDFNNFCYSCFTGDYQVK
jgi:amidophosphoribosyltransferase